MSFFWIIIFLVSLAVMVKGADWFLHSSEHLGLALGLSPFIVGITIVATGTSLPELISSLFAVSQGVTDIVVGNAVGSNIANILLIAGISAIIGKKLFVDKDLINLDLPLLATSTALFLFVAIDGIITFPEAIILLVGYGIYFLYSIFYKEENPTTTEDLLLKKEQPTLHILESLDGTSSKKPSFTLRDFGLMVIGILGLIFGSKYLIESVIHLSLFWNIAPGVIAVSAVAIGTSLPELLVSGMAAWKGKADVALGNIFGSNVFNILVVVGIPALFQNLAIDEKTFTLGLPFLAVATFLFILSSISRKLYSWEGAFFILIYALFIAKLFALF